MVVIDAHMHLNGTLADPLKYPALKDQPGAASQSCFAWFGRGDRPDGDASVEALRERMAAYGLSPSLPSLPLPSLTRPAALPLRGCTHCRGGPRGECHPGLVRLGQQLHHGHS